MRQDKDRGGKWLLTHHGDAVLTLAGITGFTDWRPLQPETVAPRRLPDGLLEVRFPDRAEPTLVLVEIETYPDPDADRQVLDDLMLIAVDRRTTPEVVSLILKPKGNMTVSGAAEQTSPSGRTRVGGSWPVVRLWELEAEALFATGDAGLIPWVPLTRSPLAPDELMARCRDRLGDVPNPSDRAGLEAVTQILAGLAFPSRTFLDLFGGGRAMIHFPEYDEVLTRIAAPILEKQRRAVRLEVLREDVVENLAARFGPVAPDRVTALQTVEDEARLKALHRLAITCADLDTFTAALATPT